MATRRVLYRIGDIVSISTEQILYRNKIRIDGKEGKLLSKSNAIGTILLKNKMLIENFPLQFLSTPKWYYKLSAERMSKLRL